jgi:hypothetical protein
MSRTAVHMPYSPDSNQSSSPSRALRKTPRFRQRQAPHPQSAEIAGEEKFSPAKYPGRRTSLLSRLSLGPDTTTQFPVMTVTDTPKRLLDRIGNVSENDNAHLSDFVGTPMDVDRSFDVSSYDHSQGRIDPSQQLTFAHTDAAQTFQSDFSMRQVQESVRFLSPISRVAVHQCHWIT